MRRARDSWIAPRQPRLGVRLHHRRGAFGQEAPDDEGRGGPDRGDEVERRDIAHHRQRRHDARSHRGAETEGGVERGDRVGPPEALVRSGDIALRGRKSRPSRICRRSSARRSSADETIATGRSPIRPDLRRRSRNCLSRARRPKASTIISDGGRWRSPGPQADENTQIVAEMAKIAPVWNSPCPVRATRGRIANMPDCPTPRQTRPEEEDLKARRCWAGRMRGTSLPPAGADRRKAAAPTATPSRRWLALGLIRSSGAFHSPERAGRAFGVLLTARGARA